MDFKVFNKEKFLLDIQEKKEKNFSLQCISCVDFVHSFQLSYFFCNFSPLNPVFDQIKIVLKKEEIMESISQIFLSADWHEREIYDLFGITFHNHKNLQRILCADNWEGFPLRKDYLPVVSFEGKELFPDRKMNFEERFCE